MKYAPVVVSGTIVKSQQKCNGRGSTHPACHLTKTSQHFLGDAPTLILQMLSVLLL